MFKQSFLDIFSSRCLLNGFYNFLSSILKRLEVIFEKPTVQKKIEQPTKVDVADDSFSS
jgi:hypothetical protein